MTEEKPKSSIVKREEKILEFWNKEKIFEKTLQKKGSPLSTLTGKKEFVFYDGPPFATGTPHYGHILAGTIKDVIPRFETMRGKFVKRRWGWDCHGLPIENLVEKELGLETKKDIEKYGIEKFNEAARGSVMRYEKEWKKIVPRTGRWVDMENDYKTMDSSYTESVWWSFKTLFDNGLIYEGFKSMHLCPRCETTLSNFEVNQGYKDITDISVTVKFELVDQPETFLLVWTTTPWTLPGNAAAAVSAKNDYVKVKIAGGDFGGQLFVLAKDLLGKVLKDKQYEVVGEFKGSELIGKSYRPVFDYYADDKALKNNQNGWKVYGADFVTMEDGTGIVHIAPAFGEDDMELGKKENLPFIQHVGIDGKFIFDIKDFAGQAVKPKGDHQKADIEIIKHLAHKNVLFSKEKITHSYPHCWRCGTPLLNYASNSWFVKVADLKDKMVAENKKVSWVPADIKEGRFGKWLEGARDWAISRSRYWGAPLPVWRCDSCKKIEALGSVEELRSKTKSNNSYVVMRHGQAENNTLYVASGDPKIPHHLTDEGIKQVEKTASKLKKEKFDLIVVSPHIRTKETAEIVARILGMDNKSVIEDVRIAEPNLGVFNGKDFGLYKSQFSNLTERFYKPIQDGETYADVKKRVGDFLYETDNKYSGKKILIVTHELPAWLMRVVATGRNPEDAIREESEDSGDGEFMPNAGTFVLDFAPIPHNRNYELDFHRPYIDDVEIACFCGGNMKRVPEIFDTWYESGSMPYAQNHYPFGDKKNFDPKKGVRFPADFIAEGVDQTRGWFYSLLVLSVGLFEKTPYENVIVNGIILAEDGQKMSKSLKNYPDPWFVLDNYGADAMRYYLLSSPVVRAEDLFFSEKNLDEVVKKVIMRLDNVYSFYEMYKGDEKASSKSINVLDRWILARLNQAGFEMTSSLEKYELDKASRPIADFVDDLSTWYLRRSRDRLKGDDLRDKNSALETLRFVLREFSKLLAPFMPFLAEDLYLKVKDEKSKESVHLEDWPKFAKLGKAEAEILETMSVARKIVEIGLSLRAEKGIKVRQPLAKIGYEISNDKKELGAEYEKIVAEELNVKKVTAEKISGDAAGGVKVILDTVITSELEEEGTVREVLRNIQDLRKKEKLNPKDKITLEIETDENGKKLLEKFKSEITKTAGIENLIFNSGLAGDPVSIGELKFVFKITK